MPKEEYFKWKKECPNEWHEAYIESMKFFLKNTYMKGMHNDDVVFASPNTDKNKQIYTVKRIANALVFENDDYDEYILLVKNFNDEINNRKVELYT